MKEREVLFLFPPNCTRGRKASEQVISQVRESHQRLRIFGIMKTFSSEFGSLGHPQRITDIS